MLRAGPPVDPTSRLDTAGWFTGFHHPDAIVFADGTTWQWKDVPKR